MAVKLFAISDLHVGFEENRRDLAALAPRPEDWLAIAGDVGETLEHLDFALDTLGPKFRRLIWVPGNHELWSDRSGPRGEEKYQRLVELCRARGVLTPEDPYPIWEGEGGPHVIAPLFLLYDYSFRPAEVPLGDAVAWAAESGVVAADELHLDPHPHASREEWCAGRVRMTEERLAASPGHPTVLVNHFPLRRELARLRLIPRFSIWCGTTLTEEWHVRFRARVVVSGHLHVPSTTWIDGVRFEEVSLGYPRQRPPGAPVELRQILPEPPRRA